MEKLEREFEEEIRGKTASAKKEYKYNPTRFNQMMTEYGAVGTAKRLIHKALETGYPSDGYTTLLLCGRPDLTMEESVCNPKYQLLFTDEEISYCKRLQGISDQ